MIKKIVSGLLSAVMSTVMITADYNTVSQNEKSMAEKEKNSFSNEGMSVNSTNSLGNYISDAIQSKEQAKNMAYQWRTDYDFDIGFAEFDRESGIMTIYSSQPDDAKIVIVVKEDESNEVVYTTELDVNKGENTINTVNIDVNVLPEFFYVELKLFDRYNKAVGQAYTLNTYTRFTQDMKATDIYDFEEEYVVNLDEDETTNFVVLNEGTIKGETTENKNILISADYQKDQYIFENIDDTIRYLCKGDHFFIQPTDNDIIALSVGDITIEGDRAILTGDENTEGLFDVIKIDTQGDDISDGIVDEGSKLENLNTNDEVENEPEYSFDSEYNYESKSVNLNFENGPDSKKIELEFEFSNNEEPEKNLAQPDFSNKNIEIGKKKIKIDPDVSGKLKLAAEFKFQYYQKWLHVEFELKFSPSFTFEFECKGKIKVPIYKGQTVGLVVIPGLWFGFKPDFSLVISGAVKFKKTFGFDHIISFDTERDKKLSLSCIPVDDDDAELNVEADVGFVFNLQPMFYIFSEKVAAMILSTPVEFGVTATSNNLLNNLVSRSDTSSQTILYKNIREYDEDTVHSCKLCWKLKPYLKFEVGFELDVKCLPFLDKIEKKFIVYNSKEDEDSLLNNTEYYVSVTHLTLGRGECPYKAYKTTFDLSGSMEVNEAGAEVTVDGVTGITDNDGIINFYCENGSHYYYVSVDGEKIKSGSFEIDDATKFIGISLVDKNEISSDGSKIVTTVPAVTDFNIPSYIEDIPKMSEEKTYIESGRLGDDIFYYIYPNGEMNIHGSGKMYESEPEIKNKDIVTTVFFIDNSIENDEYITSISKGLFNGFTNLETVYLSNEITDIGNKAFKDCTKLKNFRYGGEDDTTETLVLPAKLISIGEYAFQNCNSAAFGALVFSDKLESIGYNAFSNNPTITSIYIPENVTSIGSDAFSGCVNMTKAEVRANIQNCGGLFCGNKALNELILPSFITINGSQKIRNIFNNNATMGGANGDVIPDKLTKITVLSGDVIPDYAFDGLQTIETIVIPSEITKIGKDAFLAMENLKKIECVDGKEYSFSELFKNVTSIGYRAFRGCSQLQIGKLVLGDNLEVIEESAFENVTTMTSLYIPESVTSIGGEAFSGCTSLKEIDIRADFKENKCGVIFRRVSSVEKLTLSSFYVNGSGCVKDLFYLAPDDLTNVTVLSGDTVPKNAFDFLYNITALGLPNELTTVDVSATNDLRKLEEVFYSGTDEEWEKIDIREDNDPLLKAKRVKPIVYGDANGDGGVDMSDVVLIMQALSNPNRYGVGGTEEKALTDQGILSADVDKSVEGLTVNDALKIQQYLLGLIPSLT